MCAYSRLVVGTRIKAQRKALGLTQRKLASALGVSVSTVVRWERSRFVPVARLDQLAATLETSVAHLIGGEE